MIKKIMLMCLVTFIFQWTSLKSSADDETILSKSGISIIPYPQVVVMNGNNFVLSGVIQIHLDKGASTEDYFSANELARQLKDQFGIQCELTENQGSEGLFLTRKATSQEIGEQGYQLEVTTNQIIVRSKKAAGLFYGVQTLLQLVQYENNAHHVKGLKIIDWPDIPIRAVHYDTKHFQERKEYVFNFIRTLAGYKINMLIWEWEDKFAYKSHPEIGAPGAFTMEEMQEFTRYARKFHIQIVPLVQGLGHVSFILKHPENKHLRELESNNWGFCPLREGTYELMSDLVNEAIEATPGSEYFHIGCDETYVLGEGVACGCKEIADKEGKFTLMETYVNRVAEMAKAKKRQPMSWVGGYDPDEKIKPVKGLFTPGGFVPELDKAALENGYPLYIYDPNPGIEHLFLPYFYREDLKGPTQPHLEAAWSELTQAAKSGKYKGMISTSWNCSGVHNQIWMLRYITAANYSWNGRQPGLEEFKETYFKNYYGPQGEDIKELFMILNKASYYYMNTFERKVWHWGEVGKTHLPDLPRDDMEYDPYWNTEYADLTMRSMEIPPQMEKVLEICRENLQNGVKNSYDFELFEGLANLFNHTANTVLALSSLEKTIERAAGVHFDDSRSAYNELSNAVKIIEDNIAERNKVFNGIKNTWEKSQLPKGMSTPANKYVHGRDEQRNFANRRPDLSFMICDEEALGLEDYLKELRSYMDSYKQKYLSE